VQVYAAATLLRLISSCLFLAWIFAPPKSCLFLAWIFSSQEKVARSTSWGLQQSACWPLKTSLVTWTLGGDDTVLADYALTTTTIFPRLSLPGVDFFHAVKDVERRVISLRCCLFLAWIFPRLRTSCRSRSLKSRNSVSRSL